MLRGREAGGSWRAISDVLRVEAGTPPRAPVVAVAVTPIAISSPSVSLPDPLTTTDRIKRWLNLEIN